MSDDFETGAEPEVIGTISEQMEKLYVSYDILKESVDELSDWDSLSDILRNMRVFKDFVLQVVALTEKATVLLDGSAGSVNKLHACVDFIDDKIDMPFYIDMFDGPMLKIVVSLIVSLMNDKYGSVWSEEVLDKPSLEY